jgi:hypothetical protein
MVWAVVLVDNHRKPLKTVENHRKPSKTIENHRKPSKTIENDLKTIENHRKTAKTAKTAYDRLIAFNSILYVYVVVMASRNEGPERADRRFKPPKVNMTMARTNFNLK